MARIALLVRALDSSGGAEQSMLTLKNHLRDKYNHDVHLFGIGSYTQSNKDTTAIPLFSRRRTYCPAAIGRLGRYIEGFTRFRRTVEAFNPDMILSQHELALLGARLRSSTGTPHILFFRDYEMSQNIVNINRHSAALAADRLVWPFTDRIVQYIINNTDVTIANSGYVASVYQKERDINPFVIYPFIDISKYQVKREGDFILHVTPTLNKGIDKTLAIADRLPDETFLVIGGKATSRIRKIMEAQSNVIYKGYCEDMNEVYRQSKLVLVPSRWDEPFGRVPIEAGASGIPTIGSNKGGLPEAIADNERIVKSSNIEAYVKTIERVCSDYKTYGKRARKNAYNKRADSQLQKFDEIFEKCNLV